MRKRESKENKKVTEEKEEKRERFSNKNSAKKVDMRHKLGAQNEEKNKS